MQMNEQKLLDINTLGTLFYLCYLPYYAAFSYLPHTKITFQLVILGHNCDENTN